MILLPVTGCLKIQEELFRLVQQFRNSTI